jgi:hypothetical protein
MRLPAQVTRAQCVGPARNAAVTAGTIGIVSDLMSFSKYIDECLAVEVAELALPEPGLDPAEAMRGALDAGPRHYLTAVAAALNSRLRKTLGWKTPAEALDEFLAGAV